MLGGLLPSGSRRNQSASNLIQLTQHPGLVRFAEGHGFRQADSGNVGSPGVIGHPDHGRGKELIIILLGPRVSPGAIPLAFFGPWKRVPGGGSISLLYQVSSTGVRSWRTGCGAGPTGKPRITARERLAVDVRGALIKTVSLYSAEGARREARDETAGVSCSIPFPSFRHFRAGFFRARKNGNCTGNTGSACPRR